MWGGWGGGGSPPYPGLWKVWDYPQHCMLLQMMMTIRHSLCPTHTPFSAPALPPSHTRPSLPLSHTPTCWRLGALAAGHMDRAHAPPPLPPAPPPPPLTCWTPCCIQWTTHAPCGSPACSPAGTLYCATAVVQGGGRGSRQVVVQTVHSTVPQL